MIQEIKSTCLILTNSLHYPEIVQQLISFTKECISYDIDFESLPCSTAKEKDIKKCVRAIAPLFQESPTIDLIKKNIQDASEITIYPFYQTLFHKKIVDYLVSINATTKNYKNFESPEKTVYFALNQAREAEAIAQWILTNRDQKVLLICCETSTLPLMLTSSLERYGINHSIDFSFKPPVIVDHFLILYRYYLRKDIASLKECLSNAVFSNDTFNELLTYINLINLTYNDLFKPLTHYQNIDQYNTLDKRDQIKLKKLEQKAEEQRNTLLKYLDANDNPLMLAFDRLASNIANYDSMQRQVLFNIKETVEQVLFSKLDSEAHYIVIEYLLSSLSLSKSAKPTNVTITSLENGYQTGYDCAIILGANQQNYPGFSKKTGIIDEEYLKNINYPTLESRLLFHTQQLNRIMNVSPEIIISYSTSTFEGKTLSESFDLVQAIPKKPWPLYVFGNRLENNYSLSPSIAQELFFKDKSLFGSVSSFEVFFQCHYRYYLQVGLKLSKNDVEPTLVAMIGTIAHGIVEDLSLSAYEKLTDEQLKEKISHYFIDLYKLYPHQKKYWDFIELRLFNQMKLELIRLQESEKSTDFKFKEAEKEFLEPWIVNDNQKIIIKGFIDRVDMTNDFFRILDYKSSEKNLSYAKVKAGLQLQLLTYLVIADHMFLQKASGVHYFSFLNKVVDIVSQKVSNNKLITYSENEYIEFFHKKHKISSWFVNDDASMYHSDWFIKNITKTNKINKSGLYDLSKIKDFLEHIYASMATTLENGKILRNPTKDACTYCDFKYICIFKGKVRDYEDYQVENTLKGDDSNA